MAGKTPARALAAFVRPLRQVLSCITTDALVVDREAAVASEPTALTLGPTRLAGPAHVSLLVELQYRIVPARGARGPWKASTLGYAYAIEDEAGHEVLVYHWHPGGRSAVKTPHLTLGAGAGTLREELVKAHLPTSRIALEEVVRLLIVTFSVKARRADWDLTLSRTQAAYERWRTRPMPQRD